ncbi:hypothetical protein XELAEV_18012569mg [Xenopus laevis]|uniref:Uncharacterized protein n=1 Tax=Xenopus laevis TaxID=8355 RepID=A0A974DP26_XENLA|nr:hypothetical protein XELAEV_18012569mg [Xenopus laevis]
MYLHIEHLGAFEGAEHGHVVHLPDKANLRENSSRHVTMRRNACNSVIKGLCDQATPFCHMHQLRWMVLQVVSEPTRGGDFDRMLLQKEVMWIDKLNSMAPVGLNEDLSYSCFF